MGAYTRCHGVIQKNGKAGVEVAFDHEVLGGPDQFHSEPLVLQEVGAFTRCRGGAVFGSCRGLWHR